jgi:Predicted transcriptional regulator with C-terminal CBS domains
MNISEEIKKRRKENGLTQKQLALLSGLSESAIRQYELKLRTPKTEQLQKIAEALGCSINSLLGVDKDSENNIAYYLEKIYSLLGYSIYIDDPEHPIFIIHDKKSYLVRGNELDNTQNQILNYIRFCLESIIQKDK